MQTWHSKKIVKTYNQKYLVEDDLVVEVMDAKQAGFFSLLDLGKFIGK